MLYGWLEVGASNVGVFSSQCNQDIILRTTSSNNKIIIGNQIYDITSGSNMRAAMYVLSNNVGINKVPTSNVQLDINGTFNINNSMTFIETMTGVPNQPTFFVNSNNAFYMYYNGQQKIRFTDTNGINVSDKMYSTSDIFSPAFNVTSDSNLKRDITHSDKESDSATLNSINVFNYRFYNSTSNVKGFVAQQVESFFPQAIQKTMGFIPSSVTSVFLSLDGIVPKNNIPFDVEVGEKVVATSFGRPCEFIVYKITDENVHLYGDKQYMGFKIDITGKNGFIRTIDTTQILGLCLNSIKHLNDKVDVLEKTLQEMIETLHSATTTMQSSP